MVSDNTDIVSRIGFNLLLSHRQPENFINMTYAEIFTNATISCCRGNNDVTFSRLSLVLLSGDVS